MIDKKRVSATLKKKR